MIAFLFNINLYPDIFVSFISEKDGVDGVTLCLVNCVNYKVNNECNQHRGHTVVVGL